MIKRIALRLIIILLLSISAYGITDNDCVSLYYSDIFNSKDARIVDQLYELGFMNGILTPKEGKQGIFAPNDGITYQEFYAITNSLIEKELNFDKQRIDFITHKEARNVYIKLFFEYDIKNCDLPECNQEIMTRLEMAKLVYTYINEQGLIPLESQIVDYALNFLGYKYIWGGNSPKGFDCSGFVQYVMKHFDITIGRTCNAQYGCGTYVGRENLRPGDIVFFERTYAARGCTHVGIYIGNNEFIHAANSTKGVIISSLKENYYSSRFVGGKRMIEEDEN